MPFSFWSPAVISNPALPFPYRSFVRCLRLDALAFALPRREVSDYSMICGHAEGAREREREMLEKSGEEGGTLDLPYIWLSMFKFNSKIETFGCIFGKCCVFLRQAVRIQRNLPKSHLSLQSLE